MGKEMNGQNSTDGGIFEPLEIQLLIAWKMESFFSLFLSVSFGKKKTTTPQDFGNASIG